jgi:hypothetical protein
LAPLFSGRVLPTPPQQGRPWIPPPTSLPPAFVSATAKLFEQGLPDPRGCEYHEIEVAGQSLFDMLVSRARESVHRKQGWVLPRSAAGGQRFAIQWDGLIYPVVKVGLKADVTRHVEAAIKLEEEDQSRPNDLRACLLLRAGHVTLAERAWKTRLGRFRESEQYAGPARTWTWNLFDRGVRDHIRADDRLAILRLRELMKVRREVLKEAVARGALDLFGGETSDRIAQAMLSHLADEDVPVLLADQERRAAERRTIDWATELRRARTRSRRIASLIRALDRVGAQAPALDNPGSPELDRDPIFRALVREGAEAVGPLVDCVERDARLTRSVAYWRFATHGGRMVSVAGASYVALGSIVGRDDLARVEATVPYTGEFDAEYRSALAARIRRHLREGTLRARPPLPGWEKVVDLPLQGTPFRKSLELIYQGTGLEYSVDARIPDVPVDLKLKGMKLKPALRALRRFMQERVAGFTVNTDTELWAYRVRAPKHTRSDYRVAAAFEPDDAITEEHLRNLLARSPGRHHIHAHYVMAPESELEALRDLLRQDMARRQYSLSFQTDALPEYDVPTKLVQALELRTRYPVQDPRLLEKAETAGVPLERVLADRNATAGLKRWPNLTHITGVRWVERSYLDRRGREATGFNVWLRVADSPLGEEWTRVFWFQVWDGDKVHSLGETNLWPEPAGAGRNTGATP